MQSEFVQGPWLVPTERQVEMSVDGAYFEYYFLIKRDGILFSAEPNNLLNKHSFKFSGLANKKSLGVSVSKDGKVSLNIKRSKRVSRPSSSSRTVALNRHHAAHGTFAASTIRTLTQKSHYRADLTNFAIARYHALKASTKVRAPRAPRKSVRKSRRTTKA